MPLLTAVRVALPETSCLHINENFGGVLSEAMMTGRMDMALLYDAGPIKGVDFERLLTEELMVVAPAGTGLPGDTGTAVAIKDLVDLPLLLPGPMHTIRKVVEQAYERAFEHARVVGEVESVDPDGAGGTKWIGCDRITVLRGPQDHECRRTSSSAASNRPSKSRSPSEHPANQPLSRTRRGGARGVAHCRRRLHQEQRNAGCSVTVRVSMGASRGRPAAKRSTLALTWSASSAVSLVAGLATCGVMIALGRVHSGCPSGSGSGSVTSCDDSAYAFDSVDQERVGGRAEVDSG